MLSTRELMLLGLIDSLRDAEDEELDERLDHLWVIAEDIRKLEKAPDPMPAGWNRPAPASQEDLENALENALEHVRMRDSWEGLIHWTMPTDESELEGADYGLLARYRVGNLEGQGGMHVFAPLDTP